ncbi:MAG: hypothetical protein CMF50_01245 [Legionellales bacterium]|mgnify:CR=1 FL=1|nr:hypothetical protein [Legionellales bacterium]|tara:strand:+ start:2821 stop:4203 length:1383 start_codon:yes stop_codon:yes gene_type:complete
MGKHFIKQVLGNSRFWSGVLSVGIYYVESVKKAVLIDSGLDTSTAKTINKMIKKDGYTVGAIINTHSHADHCGGNQYFQSQYSDIEIHATRFEQHFIEFPSSEPSCFCQGAEALHELRNKHLEAKSSRVTHPIEDYRDQGLTIFGETFRLLALPGHTPGMIGVISPDNVFYTGDSIFGLATFVKHGVLFYTNIGESIQSLEKISKLDVDGTVYYHGGLHVGEPLAAAAERHIQKIRDTQDKVHAIISREPIYLERLSACLSEELGMPSSITQSTLTQACTRAYVANLEKEGRVKVSMVGQMQMISSTIAAACTTVDEPATVEVCESLLLQSCDKVGENAIHVKLSAASDLCGEMHIDNKVLSDVSKLASQLIASGYELHNDMLVDQNSKFYSLANPKIVSQKDSASRTEDTSLPRITLNFSDKTVALSIKGEIVNNWDMTKLGSLLAQICRPAQAPTPTM